MVLGEGPRDKSFLTYLCEDRQVTGLTVGWVGGNGGFGTYLDAMFASPRFGECEAILLMSDNDESATGSFGLIKRQLRDIGFPDPPGPLNFGRKQGYPPVAVLMLPYPEPHQDARGCLETMLIPAMDSVHPSQAACVDKMLDCVGAGTWPKKGAQHKAKVRCLISAVSSDDPMYGLNLCFPPEKNLIPLGHAVFDDIAMVLRHFQAWSNSGIRSWSEWRGANGV